MPRAIPYIDTTVSVEKTVADIEAILRVHNASHIMKEFESGRIKSVAFKHDNVPFQLPTNVDAVYQFIIQDRKDRDGRYRVGRYMEWEGSAAVAKAKKDWFGQAERCAWRNVMFWVKAQLALVEIGMVTVSEVFLPYMLMDGQQTLYDRMMERGLAALPSGRDE